MIYIVSLDQEEDITGLIFSGDKEVAINFLIESDIKRKTIEHLIRGYLDEGGYYFFIDSVLHCAIDPYFDINIERDIYYKFIEFIKVFRNNKLEELGV
jgi:hypothetical protein